MSEQSIWRCLDCGEEIENGRSDKRYCDDICRARANRKKLRLEKQAGYEHAHKAVIRILKTNYNLLKKALLGREETVVDFEPLYGKGFNILFYTSIERTANNGIRYFCFELGWQDIGDARLSITIDPKKLRIDKPQHKI